MIHSVTIRTAVDVLISDNIGFKTKSVSTYKWQLDKEPQNNAVNITEF